MSLNDLPQIGKNFSAKSNISGHQSLHTKLTHLSHRSGAFNVLKEDDVAKISDKFDNPLIKKAVKYHGGLSEYQAKAIKHQLTSDHIKDPHNFSAYKLKVAKQVVDHYKRQDEKPATPVAIEKIAEKPRPILHLARAPIEDISPPHRVSVSPLGRQANLPGAGVNNLKPTPPRRPPPVKLVV